MLRSATAGEDETQLRNAIKEVGSEVLTRQPAIKGTNPSKFAITVRHASQISHRMTSTKRRHFRVPCVDASSALFACGKDALNELILARERKALPFGKINAGFSSLALKS